MCKTPPGGWGEGCLLPAQGLLGFMDVWLAQGVGSVAGFINVFKIRVRDVFIQEWHARLENSTRARFYMYISNFKHQIYLEFLVMLMTLILVIRL